MFNDRRICTQAEHVACKLSSKFLYVGIFSNVLDLNARVSYKYRQHRTDCCKCSAEQIGFGYCNYPTFTRAIHHITGGEDGKG